MRTPLAAALALTSLAACVAAADDEPAESEATQALNGDVWTTLDDHPYTAGLGADFTGVAAAPNGDIWVVGSRTENQVPPSLGGTTWLVRQSTNGTTFAQSNAWRYATNRSAQATAVSVDGAGRIFVTGQASDADNFLHWITRRSTDRGATWTTVDDFSAPEHYGFPQAMTIDEAGEIFVAGAYGALGEPSYWKVRRSTDHGATWTEVDSVNEGMSTLQIDALPQGLCFAAGRLYASGVLDLTGPGPHRRLQVRKTGNGTTWGTAEILAPTDADAYGTGCGASGSSLLVAGRIVTGSGNQEVDDWLVQRSDDGITFTTADDVHGPWGGANAVREGQAGTTYAVGFIGTSWRARRTHDLVTWTDSDGFTLGGYAAQARMLKYSAARHATYVVGMAYDPAGTSHGIVRKLDDAGAH